MKKLLFVFLIMIAIVGITAFNSKDGISPMDSNGAPAGYCNDPAGGNKTCAASGCHSGAPVGNLTGVITSNIPIAGYIPGNTYTVTANFLRSGHTTFGFEISPQNPSGTKLGTMAIQNNETKLISGNKYITHTNTGNSGNGSKIWSFLWTAPATGQGPVTFYGAFNAANSDNNKMGDSIFTSALGVYENMTGIHESAASDISLAVFPNPVHDQMNVTFSLPESSSIEIDMFDIQGNKTGHLLSKRNLNGEVSESFDISSYSQGIYFLRLNIDGKQAFQEIVKL